MMVTLTLVWAGAFLLVLGLAAVLADVIGLFAEPSGKGVIGGVVAMAFGLLLFVGGWIG
jgi:hypothetical protein